MARAKIDYGIDLGTTNSAIARIENGEVKIMKSDTQEDTLPSCVLLRKSSIRVGRVAYNRLSDEHLLAFSDFSKTGDMNTAVNTFAEFKRTMGTDKSYASDSAGRSFNSEELSAEVLIQLKSVVRDEELSSVVITVPSRFRNQQIDATQRAAELAGFEYCELLAEPIAASIAYGVSAKNVNGYWLVFDFGGGTFDAALMQVEEGIMKVVDTDGDNHLGGKDLDYAIVDHIIIPYIKENHNLEKLLSNEYGKRKLREALKFKYAEGAKIDISPPGKSSASIETDAPLGQDDNGKEMQLDMTMSLQEFEHAAAPIFQRAIDIAKKLVQKNNLKTSELEMVLLVGGPTLSQTMRKMLKEQFDTRIDTRIDPMTCVAAGAALFASSKDIPTSIQKRDRQKIQLILKYPATSVEKEENLGIKIDRAQTEGAVPERLFAEISSKDRYVWSSGRVEVVGDAEIIPVPLTGGNNAFQIAVFDEKGSPFPCEPASFSIRQGSVDPEATLSFSLGIAVYDAESSKVPLDIIKGLEKNDTLPAKGKAKYKTQKAIRPGAAQDIIEIAIYEGEASTRAIYNEPAGFVRITGEDLPKFLPEGSEVEITLSMDKSRRITLSIFFPDLDETIDRTIDPSIQREHDPKHLENEIAQAHSTLTKIEDESNTIDLSETDKLKSEFAELNDILARGRTDYETKLQVKERLREGLKKLDRIEEDSEWPRVEDELNEAIEGLLITDQRYGNEGSTQHVKQIQQQSKALRREMNVKAAKDLAHDVRGMIFQMNWQQLGFLVSYIKYYDENFNDCAWTNRLTARRKVDEAKVIATGNPTVRKLQEKIEEIWEDLPDHTPPPVGAYDELLTKYW